MRVLPTAILGAAVASALITTAMAAAVLAQPMAMPGRRAGLWEMSMSSAAMQGHAMKMRQCVDPATERNFSPFNSGSGGHGADAVNCSKRDVHRIVGGWAFESVCTQNGKPVTSSGTITGDFQSHYRMELATTGGGGGPQHMTMDNTWVGACTPGGQGNTVTLPDGRVITIPRRH